VKKLPNGIQTFSRIIEENFYYIDKTEILHKLTQSGTYYFLSRPRRFGKSLFLDTLKEAYSGNQNLFKGLFLDKHWDWCVKHPVIKIDFGGGVHKNPITLEQYIREIFNEIAKQESIKLQNESIGGIFRELILELEIKYLSKVVVLVDEYDKPILDNITESAKAKEMRDILRNLYSVIKISDAHIKFVFITGVSKFSKVNLFSGLNNIEDITLNPEYSSICGYTESELIVFQDRMEDVNRDELRLWYNGYNFLGDKVYNPYDILLYLKSKQFKNYWFETGNPTFLLDLIEKNQYNSIDIERVVVSEEELGSFDVDEIKLEVLLFQTGYLTILEKRQVLARTQYILTYPNQEIKLSLTAVILNFLTKDNRNADKEYELYTILVSGELSKLKALFFAFFASIPHDWYRKNQLAGYEAYYASIFYCYFAALGLDVRPEDHTNVGQADLVVILENKVFVFEFKVIELTNMGSALDQIKEKKYYEKYLSSQVGDGQTYHQRGTNHKQGDKIKEIYLIGVEFSKLERNITNFEWEKIL
jgi:hypothetical protein